MSRVLVWIIVALIAFWVLGFVLKLAFKILIIGTIAFIVLSAFGLIGKRR